MTLLPFWKGGSRNMWGHDQHKFDFSRRALVVKQRKVRVRWSGLSADR